MTMMTNAHSSTIENPTVATETVELLHRIIPLRSFVNQGEELY